MAIFVLISNICYNSELWIAICYFFLVKSLRTMVRNAITNTLVVGHLSGEERQIIATDSLKKHPS